MSDNQDDIAPEKRRGTQAGDVGRPLTPEELSLAIHKNEKHKGNGGVRKYDPASERSLLFKARKADFAEWLEAQAGAVLLETASQWEVMRYTAPASGLHKPKKGRRIKHIIYRNAQGRVTFSADSSLHFSLFIANLPIPDYLTSAPVLSKEEEIEKKRTWAMRTREKLYERDGFDCWFCHEKLEGDVTIEHVLAQHNGGTDDLENLVLAHRACNQRAGHKSVEEKLAIREFYRKGLHTDVKHWKNDIPKRSRKRR